MTEDVNTRPPLDSILDTMPSGLFALDLKCCITLWNRAMEELTGYTAAEVLGRECVVLRCEQCREPDGPLSISSECQLMQESDPATLHQVECRIRDRQGRSIPVLRRARVLFDEDKRPWGLVETVTDLRREKQLEAELQAWRGTSLKSDMRGRLTGQSQPMHDVFERIDLAAASETTVLITGPTGTGKELAAEAIH